MKNANEVVSLACIQHWKAFLKSLGPIGDVYLSNMNPHSSDLEDAFDRRTLGMSVGWCLKQCVCIDFFWTFFWISSFYSP